MKMAVTLLVASECWCTAACTRGVAIYRRFILLFWSVVSQAISQTGRLHIATTFPVAFPWGYVLSSVSSLALRGIDWIARLVRQSIRQLDSRYATDVFTGSGAVLKVCPDFAALLVSVLIVLPSAILVPLGTVIDTAVCKFVCSRSEE